MIHTNKPGAVVSELAVLTRLIARPPGEDDPGLAEGQVVFGLEVRCHLYDVMVTQRVHRPQILTEI